MNTSELIIYNIPHSHDDVGWLSTQEEYYREGNPGRG
jgi:hypothetical protein